MTLYDILPPIVFFASLGGITLVVSRVLLRLRHFQSGGFGKSRWTRNTIQKVSKKESLVDDDIDIILMPNRKGVQVMRSRIMLLQHTLAQSLRKTAMSIKRIPHFLRQRVMRKRIDEKLQPAQQLSVERMNSVFKKIRDAGRRHGMAQVKHTLTMNKRLVSSLRGGIENVYGKISRVIRRAPQLNNQPKIQEEKRRQQALHTTRPAPSVHLRIKSLPTHVAGRETSRRETQAPRLQTSLRMQPKQSNATPLLQQAEQALKTAHYGRVEEVLVPFLAKHPKHTEAYMLLGKAALERSAWDEALEILEQVVYLNPKYPGAYRTLGLTAEKCGRLSKALHALRRAHEAEPNDTVILEHLLSIAHKMDNRALQHSFKEELTALQKE